VRIHNVHERTLPASPEQVGALLDEVVRWWPKDRWPALRPDRPLGPGATSTRGPIRERVVEYTPGKRLAFEFLAPKGLVGRHTFEVEGATLRHSVDARAVGWQRVIWPLAILPLHDATLEDVLDRAEAETTGAAARSRPWTTRVRLLRWGYRKVAMR